MLYGKYSFCILLESEALLPLYKGSTFRGVFGVALKKVVCALKQQECENCLLRERCIYTTVFEIFPDQDSKGFPSPPHPFILEPAMTQQTHFQAGDRFDFSLILLGPSNDYLPYFVYAIEQMGRIGIGRRINGKRSRFQLQRITAGDQVVYNSADKKLVNAPLEDLSMEGLIDEQAKMGLEEITLDLLTPLRLKYDNKLQAELPFHVLVRAALRRISQLNNHFSDGEPKLDYKGLVARAEKVEIKNSTLRWFDWKRFSNRQEQSMLMGGMVGEITYRGNLREFLPLIRYAEKVHLGKATTFGLGRISLSVPSDNMVGQSLSYSSTSPAREGSFVSPSPLVGEGRGEGD